MRRRMLKLDRIRKIRITRRKWREKWRKLRLA
jgi:hypothetical protein